MQPKLTPEELAQELRERYAYNPLTGELEHRTRKRRMSSKQRCKYKCSSITVGKQKYNFAVHYAVWLWFYGKAPEQTIDHINRNRQDNRIWNLRDVNMFEQIRNSSRTRLNVDAVKIIKQRIGAGDELKSIAADHGVHPATISSIKRGTHWRNVA